MRVPDSTIALLAQSIELGQPEASFQRLFTRHPELLASALTARQDPSCIRALGRPGQSEPDFVIRPPETTDEGRCEYGIIELKRPRSRILTATRKGLIQLTREAQGAISQAESYMNTRAGLPGTAQDTTIRAFVIMGTAQELTQRLSPDEIRQFEQRIPEHIQLIPYDVLLRSINSPLPNDVRILVPALGGPALPMVSEIIRRLYDWPSFTTSPDSVEDWQGVAWWLGVDVPASWPINSTPRSPSHREALSRFRTIIEAGAHRAHFRGTESDSVRLDSWLKAAKRLESRPSDLPVHWQRAFERAQTSILGFAQPHLASRPESGESALFGDTGLIQVRARLGVSKSTLSMMQHEGFIDRSSSAEEISLGGNSPDAVLGHRVHPWIPFIYGT